MDVTCSFQVEATLVANEFIDRFMADANGEYVKVYLYVLRHGKERPDLPAIADALNHTEADVRRALLYWERLGVLRVELPGEPSAVRAGVRPEAGGAAPSAAEAPCARSQKIRSIRPGAEDGTAGTGTGPLAAGYPAFGQADPAPGGGRPVYSQEQVNRLQGDSEFSQLLYIAQRYLNRIFTQRELEVFAYLYDGLHMSPELLEYLVEYCVQNSHTSIRYIETVALNWHGRGIVTVEEAKSYSSGFTKDSFSVMRAFGLSDRKPGDAEKEMIGRWFGTFGFSRELVLEACNRTLEATHNPSFRYADKILSDWKKAGVKNLKDVTALDEKRREKARQAAGSAKGGANTGRKASNQFHNFDQRSTDYDSMVLDQVKGWIGEQ